MLFLAQDLASLLSSNWLAHNFMLWVIKSVCPASCSDNLITIHPRRTTVGLRLAGVRLHKQLGKKNFYTTTCQKAIPVAN